MEEALPGAADGHERASPRPAGHAGPAPRPTVGFLTANLHVGSSRRLWLGIVDTVERRGVNLLCFPGGRLAAGAAFEAQRNRVYDLCSPLLLDGLVSWSSTITGSFEPADALGFHQRYSGLPIVSLTQPLPGTPTLSVDSYQGMREAIIHLIEVHGRRRLAFIRGPAEHYYAQERYQAYRDVLAAYHIPFRPELVTPHCPFQIEAGAEAVQALLDEAGLRPGADFDAIVAVSDLLALGALRALQARGIDVPRDLALTGFNNSREGRLVSPPITSVAMAFYEQGARAVEMVLAQREGRAIPAQVVLQPRLVVHQSCGCPSTAIVRAVAGHAAGHAGGLSAHMPQLRARLAAELAAARPPAGGPELALDPLLDALRADLEGGGDRFLRALGEALGQAAELDSDVADLQNVVSALRGAVLPYLGPDHSRRAEDLFGQGRVLISEVAQRAQAYRQLVADQQAAALREIGQELITAFDLDSLTDVLAERLPALGISSGYLALYAGDHTRARLALAYTERGRAALDPDDAPFPAHELVPAPLLPRHRRYSMVVEPLFFRDDQLGYAVFEIGPRDPAVYEVLRGSISSALKGALLAQETRRARLAAEKADQIKTRLLANVSHELRTPLQIILESSVAALDGAAHGPAQQSRLQHIRHSAEHQLRLINDLLDLSRAEIDELDLYPETLDPRALLEETFHSLADQAAGAVSWVLALPERLPWIHADPVRLRQILLNLLSNAQKFTERGQITLGAAAEPPRLHIWVADTGVGIPAEQHERIFEPFVTAEHGQGARRGGIGLGLSITRRLVALHRGTLELSARPGGGSSFHIYLPLPAVPVAAEPPPPADQPALLVVSPAPEVAAAIVAFGRRQGLAIRRLQAGAGLEAALGQLQPAAVAWDMVDATLEDWALIRRLRQHPAWSQVPFIVYGRGPEGEPELSLGLTGFVSKPVDPGQLGETIGAACPPGEAGPVLIVDDDPAVRALHAEVVARGLPGYPVSTAASGEQAIALMRDAVPSLVLLDLVMPGLEGADVLDWMRADLRLRQVPVIILSSKLLNLDDIRRLEQHANVTLQSKGILTDDETIAALRRVLAEPDPLPAYTSALVKRALAYLHQHYARTVARWELAEAAGASEDYLGRVFSRELGLSPWEYLNRYRIYQAKELLRRTNSSVSAIAEQVGFHDKKYFSRVFRNLAGVGPKEYRERVEQA